MKEKLIKKFKKDVFDKCLYIDREYIHMIRGRESLLIIAFETDTGKSGGWYEEMKRKKGGWLKKAVRRARERMWKGMEELLRSGKGDKLNWDHGVGEFSTAKGIKIKDRKLL